MVSWVLTLKNLEDCKIVKTFTLFFRDLAPLYGLVGCLNEKS
jgi:hypothetical protein